MKQGFTPSLFDRLINDRGPASVDAGAGAAWTLEQLKDAVARDLEALLNTRAAMSETMLAAYPDVRNSLLNYGLLDFSGMCMTSDEDRKKICLAVKLAIERHEPRLHAVEAELRVHCMPINRVDFIISAMLRTVKTAAPVYFDAVLEASTQQYSIRNASTSQKYGAA